ncbi:class I SAM-dependent methyltransferase [Halorientalis pallida]|uniref:Class I SAM-dependent methyltransferase n=1 Tax=Halorientalis pallida TaxID=2479928 RepID=A0A498KWH2_9EURY|nr:class I SAM-dependent methyltransferase [Halorientalis pallida]RXK49165.1 class I SAM-dependent methyltransferase [Halorientalis pallida]
MDDDPARAGVRDTYDRIAAHFSATREYAWPEVESFLTDRTGTLGLDVGCGNGRHAELLADPTDRVCALDVSRGLLEEARERVANTDVSDTVGLVQGDASSLPVSTGTVDLAVYVATLHHLPSRELRLSSLDELARVLAPEGRALVSAWSTAHDRFDAEAGFDTTVDWTLPGGERVPRFYHIYSPDEFRADLDASGLQPVEVFVSSGNCYAVVADGERKAT